MEVPRGVTASDLTPAQQQVLRLVAQGYSYTEIATELYIAPKTARHHQSGILQRLRARNMAHAVALGYELGILGTAA